MDDGASDTIHHAAKRESRCGSWFTFIPSPPWNFAGKLRTHVGATVVSRTKFVWQIVSLGAKRARFKRDHFESGLCQDRRDDRSHRSSSDQNDVGIGSRFSRAALRIIVWDTEQFRAW